MFLFSDFFVHILINKKVTQWFNTHNNNTIDKSSQNDGKKFLDLLAGFIISSEQNLYKFVFSQLWYFIGQKRDIINNLSSHTVENDALKTVSYDNTFIQQTSLLLMSLHAFLPTRKYDSVVERA